LVANVVHDGPATPGAGTHRIFVLQRGTGKWFEMQDLHVQEILPQMIPLSLGSEQEHSEPLLREEVDQESNNERGRKEKGMKGPEGENRM
uniref:USP domain-containing protein n=1 Tax=Rodentolepis nana TaxID=102285 RepID=A0A0R3T3N7_RODNA